MDQREAPHTGWLEGIAERVHRVTADARFDQP
jgi:hypothetical protein